MLLQHQTRLEERANRGKRLRRDDRDAKDEVAFEGIKRGKSTVEPSEVELLAGSHILPHIWNANTVLTFACVQA
jgi:hypothetical protein